MVVVRESCEVCGRSVAKTDLTFGASGQRQCRLCDGVARNVSSNVVIREGRANEAGTFAIALSLVAVLTWLLIQYAPMVLVGLWAAILFGCRFAWIQNRGGRADSTVRAYILIVAAVSTLLMVVLPFGLNVGGEALRSWLHPEAKTPDAPPPSTAGAPEPANTDAMTPDQLARWRARQSAHPPH